MVRHLEDDRKPLCKNFSIQCSPLYDRALLFGRFPEIRLFVLLVGATCRVWGTDGMILTMENYPSATLFTTKSHWAGLGLKPDLSGEFNLICI
jgi:hypothetical protein